MLLSSSISGNNALDKLLLWSATQRHGSQRGGSRRPNETRGTAASKTDKSLKPAVIFVKGTRMLSQKEGALLEGGLPVLPPNAGWRGEGWTLSQRGRPSWGSTFPSRWVCTTRSCFFFFFFFLGPNRLSNVLSPTTSTPRSISCCRQDATTSRNAVRVAYLRRSSLRLPGGGDH